MFQNKILFTSKLRNLLNGYLEEQRAIGYKYIKGASHLIHLDRFLEKHHLAEKKLSKEMVQLWTEKKHMKQ